MRSRGNYLIGGFFLIILCAISVNSQAALVEVEDIQLPIPVTQVYNWSGSGLLHITGGTTSSALLRVKGAAGYEYGIQATVTLSPCNMIDDSQSSGGVAHGVFQGGATLTVTGDLWEFGSGTYYATGETLLVATMALDNWDVMEDGYEFFDGSAYFSPTNGGLNTGIAVGGGDVLTIGDFRADLSFKSMTPVNNFSSVNIMGLTNTIQITTVPEPATVLLLGFGSLLICRRKSGKEGS